MNRFAELVLAAQGWIYVVAGLWPLVSLRTFEMVTGPKVDHWLVRTVGLLTVVVGAVIVRARRRARVTPEIVLLASGVAASYVVIDAYYALAGRISPIYLADAAMELVFVVGAIVLLRRRDLAPPCAPSES